MAGVAILGYGVIGSGVAEALRSGAVAISRECGEQATLLHVLDLLDFPGSPDESVLTRDASEIMCDPRVGIVVETMGGVGPALELTKEALTRGKHVVTSNKDLVAEHGPELMSLARERGVRYLYEAAVGGGTPIIRPLERCLAANNIVSLEGIVNGTTNYMLTYMHQNGSDYEATLSEAQARGYTERNPASDVEGMDAARKLAILCSTAFGSFVDWRKIPTRGITGVTSIDIAQAEGMGAAVKLVASARLVKREGGRRDALMASVAPAMALRGHPLHGIGGAYNAISVEGDLAGVTLFVGVGAGKLPTASAVAADIIDILRSPAPPARPDWDRKRPLEPMTRAEQARCHVHPGRFYARLGIAASGPQACADALNRVQERIFGAFPDAAFLPELPGLLDAANASPCFIAGGDGDEAFADTLARVLESCNGAAGLRVAATMRLLEE